MRRSSLRVVLCHGVFDCLHPGHLYLFNEAKKHGNWLAVSLVADRFVRKGESRPVFNEQDRARMLYALRLVDQVCITTRPAWWDDHVPKLFPRAYVRGEEDTDPPECKLLSSLGAKIVFIPKLPGYSTTRMLERIGEHP